MINLPSPVGRGVKAAFTLAEVLITLGIIGVVAAMTLPSLIQDYKEKQVITALKKNYSILSNALNLAISEFGEVSNWPYGDVKFNDYEGQENEIQSIVLLDNIVPYLKLLKDCGYEAKGCFAHGYTRLNGTKERDFENLSRYRKLILSDGTLIAFHGYEAADGEIWVDINGKQGPNVVGKDMFIFSVNKSTIRPYGNNTNNCNKNDFGNTCSKYILENENMDYLK